LILQAQENQGQTGVGVVYGDGKSATPRFWGFWTLHVGALG